MNPEAPLMLDLFAGLGGASQAFAAAGWNVITVDSDPRFNCTITADLSSWQYGGGQTPCLIWASPPCEQFTRSFLPWLRGKFPEPSLDLVRSTLRIIHEADPEYWVLENVRGAIRWLKPILGPPAACYGPVMLWGRFPPFRARVAAWKEALSGRQIAERAKIPASISAGLLRAIESPKLF